MRTIIIEHSNPMRVVGTIYEWPYGNGAFALAIFHGTDLGRTTENEILSFIYGMTAVVVAPTRNRQRNVWSFNDFYHLTSIQQEHTYGFQVLPFQEFLEREAMTGQLYHRTTGTEHIVPTRES
jgi:hypothetical protein